MNSIPAASSACLIFAIVSSRPPSSPSCASSRLTVAIETAETAANCSWDQLNNARAALTCPIDTFGIDFRLGICDTFSILYSNHWITGERMMPQDRTKARNASERRYFIGGSDARIIMGNDEAALLRLWREKRGEVEPEDLSGNLIVQLGAVTEDLNRRWYELNTGQVINDVQRHVKHPVIRWMAATLDGRVEGSGAVFEAKFMLPWSFSEEAAAEKYMPQLQHNMWVVNCGRSAVLSVITGGGKWVEITDPCRSALSAPYRHRRT